MGHKNQKGTVSIINYKGRIRLRWRFQSKRYSINLNQYNKFSLREAKKIALQIEQDILNQSFDVSLNKYKGLPEQVGQVQQRKSFVQLFEEWVSRFLKITCVKKYSFKNIISLSQIHCCKF